MKYLWLWWNKEDLRTEQQQLIEEGRDTNTVESEFARLLAEDIPEDALFQKAMDNLLDKTRLLPMRPDYRYVEPSDLETIRTLRTAGPRVQPITHSDAIRRDHIAGASAKHGALPPGRDQNEKETGLEILLLPQ